MNAILFIITGLIVLAGSSLTAVAPIWKEKEKRLRIVGVCVTVSGGALGIAIGLKSAAKSDALMRSTAQILQTSGKTLSGVDETLKASKDVLKETRENLDKTKESLEIGQHLSKALAEEKALTAKNLEHITGGEGYCWVVPSTPLPVGLGGNPAYQGNNWWQLGLKNSGKVVLPTCDLRFAPFPTDEEFRKGISPSPPFLFYHFEKVPVLGRRYYRATPYFIKGDRIYSGVIETPTRSFNEVIKFEPDPNDRTRYIPKCTVSEPSEKILEKDCNPQ